VVPAVRRLSPGAVLALGRTRLAAASDRGRLAAVVAVLVLVPLLALGGTWALQHGDRTDAVTGTVDVVPPEGTTSGSTAVSGALALAAALDSDPVRRSAADTVGVGTDDLEARLTVDHQDGSPLVTLGYAACGSGPDARTVVRAVAAAGVRQVYAAPLRAARSRAVRTRAGATAATTALARFRTRNRVVAPDEEYRALLAERAELATAAAVGQDEGRSAGGAVAARLRLVRAEADRLAPLVVPYTVLVAAAQAREVDADDAAAATATMTGRLAAGTDAAAVGFATAGGSGAPGPRRSLLIAGVTGEAVAVLVLLGWWLVRRPAPGVRP